MRKSLQMVFTGIIFLTGYLILALVSKFIPLWVLAYFVTLITWFFLGFLIRSCLYIQDKRKKK